MGPYEEFRGVWLHPSPGLGGNIFLLLGWRGSRQVGEEVGMRGEWVRRRMGGCLHLSCFLQLASYLASLRSYSASA